MMESFRVQYQCSLTGVLSLCFDGGCGFLIMASPLPLHPGASQKQQSLSSSTCLRSVCERCGQMHDCACLRLPQRMKLGSYPSLANQPSSLANSRAPNLRGHWGEGEDAINQSAFLHKQKGCEGGCAFQLSSLQDIWCLNKFAFPMPAF